MIFDLSNRCLHTKRLLYQMHRFVLDQPCIERSV
nr:MAG TPA: hypothetical protein [Caudoviricetes sp.]